MLRDKITNAQNNTYKVYNDTIEPLDPAGETRNSPKLACSPRSVPYKKRLST